MSPQCLCIQMHVLWCIKGVGVLFTTLMHIGAPEMNVYQRALKQTDTSVDPVLTLHLYLPEVAPLKCTS